METVKMRHSPSDREPAAAVAKLLTVREAAEVLAVSEAAIRKWVRHQRLEAVKLGRLVRLRAADINQLAERGSLS